MALEQMTASIKFASRIRQRSALLLQEDKFQDYRMVIESSTLLENVKSIIFSLLLDIQYKHNGLTCL